MNNDDLNFHTMTKLSGLLRYWFQRYPVFIIAPLAIYFGFRSQRGPHLRGNFATCCNVIVITFQCATLTISSRSVLVRDRLFHLTRTYQLELLWCASLNAVYIYYIQQTCFSSQSRLDEKLVLNLHSRAGCIKK